MWFHLLSVAAFLALGSCQNYYGYHRAASTPTCKGLGCLCNCPDNSCPPCPIPLNPECFSGCGTAMCPCLGSNENQRSDDLERQPAPNTEKLPTSTLSTVILNPVGPICTAANLMPHLMLTVDTCIAGKPLADLYVSVNAPFIESLKVKEILIVSNATNEPVPVLLVTEKPKGSVNYLTIPPRGIESSVGAEILKWEVSKNGMTYLPMRIPVKSHQVCDNNSKRPYACVKTYDTAVMGWNDIGTAFVESFDNILLLQGLYIGQDLYKPSRSIKYLPTHQYSSFLTKMMKKYA